MILKVIEVKIDLVPMEEVVPVEGHPGRLHFSTVARSDIVSRKETYLNKYSIVKFYESDLRLRLDTRTTVVELIGGKRIFIEGTPDILYLQIVSLSKQGYK